MKEALADAIVLAGGGIERERFQGLSEEIGRKAEIPLLGRPMVEWVVRALRQTPRVGRVVVVGHPTLETARLRELEAALIPEAAGIAENLRAGLQALPGSERVLMVSGDLPLLTREAIDDLLEQAPAAEIVFPYAGREDVLRVFPDRVWVFSHTPDGQFTGSSAALFRPAAVLANWRWVEEILDARRKSVLGLAAMIGPLFALKYLFRRLRVADVEQKLSSLLHLTGRGYRTRFPELAMDVDKYTDIAFVEKLLQSREPKPRMEAPGG